MKKSNFLRYLWYRLENSALRTLVLTVLSVILTQSVISESIEYYGDIEHIKYASTGIYILAIVLGIVCTIIPMLENMGFKNRRNLDTLYFFPIRREKMAAAHFIGGFIQCVFIYTVTFAISGIYLAIYTDFFALYHLVGYYFLSILLGFVIYSFFSFIFIQANTVADGIIMSVLWMFVLWVVMYAIYALTNPLYIQEGNYETYLLSRRLSQIPEWGIVYAPLNNLTVIFQSLIEVNQSGWNNFTYAGIYRSQFGFFIAWGVIGIACLIGYFVTFARKGANKAGEISDSYLGYRLLIPLYGYSLIYMIGSVEIVTILVFMMMIIGYVIYRRSFKLKARDLVITALGVIPLIIGMV